MAQNHRLWLNLGRWRARLWPWDPFGPWGIDGSVLMAHFRCSSTSSTYPCVDDQELVIDSYWFWLSLASICVRKPNVINFWPIFWLKCTNRCQSLSRSFLTTALLKRLRQVGFEIILGSLRQYLMMILPPLQILFLCKLFTFSANCWGVYTQNVILTNFHFMRYCEPNCAIICPFKKSNKRIPGKLAYSKPFNLLSAEGLR